MSDALLGAGAVTLGALIGGPLRYAVSGAIGKRFGTEFPWGTLLVNVSGAAAIGALAAHAAQASTLWLLIGTGLLGSYTTVSSFSLQTWALARERKVSGAFAYVALSVVLCVGAAALGFVLA